ncbi:MAG: HEPN domain-containing protein [Halobacteria archaeon]
MATRRSSPENAVFLFNLQRAESSLRDSRQQLRQRDHIDAIEHAFRSAESAISAFMLRHNPQADIPRTHRGLVTVLGRDYVKTGTAPKEWRRYLGRLNSLREKFSYARLPEEAPSKADAVEAIHLAGDLLRSIKRRL